MSMSEKFNKLKVLLQELFQLDQPDLDFGLYRVLHARRVEITEFLDQKLLPQVQEAFTGYLPADRAAIERELDEAIESARKL
jgi:adenine-specific DNA-methyltransferase